MESKPNSSDNYRVVLNYVTALLSVYTYVILSILHVKVFFRSHTKLGLTASFSKDFSLHF